jgi:molecular chaperone DnaK
MRLTMDFGIDLGTTNSSIAVLKGTEAVVIKNNENDEVTPSAVWVSKQGKIFVGKYAKQQIDPEPAIEFKLKMGERNLIRAGYREMPPDALSAEVLKKLRGDAQNRLGEEIKAAVIGVPADFDLPQIHATEQAARLAGFEEVKTIQEPIAAALAYTFQSHIDSGIWLVYDLGGGTFDAAVVSIREEDVSIIAHGGDKNLGGKLIDWDIVDHIFILALKRQYALNSLNRHDSNSVRKWKSLIKQLKMEAEQVKIRLSRDLVTVALPPNNPIGIDEKGEPIWLELEVTREQIEPFIESKVERTIAIVKRVLNEKRLSYHDIERIILVGGPTLTPLLREMLQAKLGIELAFDIDPITVVAQGAAIFAGTQQIKAPKTSKLPRMFVIELIYKPIDSTTEPLIGGKVVPPQGETLDGFTIEFVETISQWRSGQVPIQSNGTFMTTLKAESGRQNEFIIELRDAYGNRHFTQPERFHYTIGRTVGTQIVTHHIGVALATGDVVVFFEKGSPLPAKATHILRTTEELKRGQSETMLRIPVVEGDDVQRADRNREVGALEVRGDSVKVWRDVPVGSEVQVTLEIDESRLLRIRAFLPLLEEEFEAIYQWEKEEIPVEELKQALISEKARFERARESALRTGNQEEMRMLHELERERILEDAENALKVVDIESDASIRCYNRIVELRRRLDEVEKAMEWDILVEEAHDTLERVRFTTSKFGTVEDQNNLKALEQQLHDAIARRNIHQTRRCIDEMMTLEFSILRNQPWFWVLLFQDLQQRRSQMRDQRQAQILIRQGNDALLNNDLSSLQESVIGLIQLLPHDEQQRVITSTVVRGR